MLADLDQGAATNFPVVGYAVTPKWAQQNPNTLKAFVTALEEGQEIADTNRPDLEKALVAVGFLKVKVNQVPVISLPNYPIGIDPDRLQRVIDDMIQFKFFKGAQVAKAKGFDIKNVTYTPNLTTTSTGESSILGG